jgi:hypothetical protein
MLATRAAANAVIAGPVQSRLLRHVFCLVSDLKPAGTGGHKIIRNEDRNRPE